MHAPAPFDVLHASADLIVYVDLKSPYAFVARAPTLALAHELGVRVAWRPLTLDIPSYLGSARLAADGRVAESRRSDAQWSAVRYAYRDTRRYGALQGHALRGTTKIWDTSLAHVGMAWATRHGDDVLERFLDVTWPRFWRRELDLEDVATVSALLAEAGADRTGFGDWAAGDGRAAHDHQQAAIFAAGIFGVPTYVFDGDTWFGREHLPLLRWRLGGRRGPAPDIAYTLPPEPGRAPLPAGARGDASGAAAEITVALDLAHPNSHLALAPTCALARRFGLRVRWLPLVVPAALPRARPGVDAASRGARHRALRAAYRQRELARLAGDLGVPLADPHRRDDSSLAALALLHVEACAPARTPDFLAALLAARFTHGQRLDDPAVVAAALAGSGFDAHGLAASAGAGSGAALAAVGDELAGLGATGAPTYVLAGDVYHDREHLPLLARLLAAGDTADGRQGRGDGH